MQTGQLIWKWCELNSRNWIYEQNKSFSFFEFYVEKSIGIHLLTLLSNIHSCTMYNEDMNEDELKIK